MAASPALRESVTAFINGTQVKLIHRLEGQASGSSVTLGKDTSATLDGVSVSLVPSTDGNLHIRFGTRNLVLKGKTSETGLPFYFAFVHPLPPASTAAAFWGITPPAPSTTPAQDDSPF